jgi:hypothetical protein
MHVLIDHLHIQIMKITNPHGGNPPTTTSISSSPPVWILMSCYDGMYDYSEQEDYEVVRKIGRGKYSEVFEGLNVMTQPQATPVCCKLTHRLRPSTSINILYIHVTTIHY